jgi:hypothetical protein
MIKPLLITSLCAFLAAAGFFSLAVASGVAHGGNDFWRNFEDFDSDNRGPRVSGDGPQTTRTLIWPGGDTLVIAVRADVKYTQGPVGSLTVTGSKGAVDHLIVDDGELKFDRRMRDTGRLSIVMTAPDVKEFVMAGSQNLSIDGYNQDKLTAVIAGSGEMVVRGAAKTLELNIAGSGDVDAGGLTLDDAEINIAGSGDATIAPRLSAEVNIAGSGDVLLKSNPPKLETAIFGSGSVKR